MFFNRRSSLPPADPYTPIPKAPRGRATSSAHRELAAHSRSVSTSSVPEHLIPKDKASKRHTYHALQSPTSLVWNRAVSLPSTEEPYARASRLPTRLRALAHQAPESLSDTPPLGHPRRLNNSDPRTLLRALNTLLDPKSQRIPDYLDVDHLMALHERDVMERDQRDTIKLKARTDRTNDGVVCLWFLFTRSYNYSDVFKNYVGTAFGTTPTELPQELREVYALLTTYLFALPEPILSSEMFEAIWAWCVLPSLRRTDFLEEDNRFRCHVPTDAGIPIAQILLRLLPLPNFSLFVYMLGFFQRLPHMVTEDVGRAVFAGRSPKPPNNTDGRAERAETMLRWFLDRWDGIFKDLFPSFEHQQTVDAWSSTSSSVTPIASRASEDAEQGLFESAIDTQSDASSVSSSCALGERLLDVTLEDAQLHKKNWDHYSFPDNASDDSGYQSPEQDHDAPPSPQPPEEREMSHMQALRRISLLERELERSDFAVAEAISETFKAREQVKELEVKLRSYEKDAGRRPPVLELKLDQRAADDWHAVLQADTEALKLQLAKAHKERDAALQLVDDIKRLMGSGGRG
ncbi:hypothetical protein C8R46DRAFT_1211134 [Mycena filopes]|nr:hypothetical protein C8R46DRAFT_1211134 [Mycena filopes]